MFSDSVTQFETIPLHRGCWFDSELVFLNPCRVGDSEMTDDMETLDAVLWPSRHPAKPSGRKPAGRSPNSLLPDWPPTTTTEAAATATATTTTARYKQELPLRDNSKLLCFI